MKSNYNFSLPIYPDLTPDYINGVFIPFLKKYKDNISDLYFTVRMDPFNQDVMGTPFSEEDIITMISNALVIQHETGIQISPVFNNIFIQPSLENLEIFITNFRRLYKAGIRSCTIPFTSWLYFNRFQQEFPDVYLKNTVVNAVDKPREVYELYKAGFDYVNLDRNLIRSQTQLKEIYLARDKAEKDFNKKLKLSILWNESCIGNCPIQKEHFQYNACNNPDPKKMDKNKVFFKSPLNQVSCMKWEKEDKNYIFKKANIIFHPVFMKGLESIDVFKMHGRENFSVFQNSLKIIEGVLDGTLKDEFSIYKDKYQIEDNTFYKWITKTVDCNFDCWNCQECSLI